MKYKTLKELSKIEFCVVSPSRLKTCDTITRWLPCACFLKDNIIEYEFTENYYCPDLDFELHDNDIVIKRIEPTFVNYIDEIEPNIYAGNNLIIVSPTQNIYPKYLAMILNNKIETLSNNSSVGAVMKSINRQDLEELTIPMIDYSKQVLVGELWFNEIELTKIKNKLIELEHIKQKEQLKKMVKTLGENYNG